MTKEEFDKKGWCAETKAEYKGIEYYVGSINFEERLVGLWNLNSDMEDMSDMIWARCENIELIN